MMRSRLAKLIGSRSVLRIVNGMTSPIAPAPVHSGLRLGATYLGDERCDFRVWAPLASEMAVELYQPERRMIPLDKEDGGYWHIVLDQIRPGTRYKFLIDGANAWPDPASQSQPDGVHESSEVVDPAFAWTAAPWHGLPVEDYIIYELHVGTFTYEGTFDAAAEQLSRLKELGITAIELMPVAQFPGSRNWGYDGVYPYAVQASYGGPAGLKRFVDQAHQQGLAVVLDVVYNHLGPEGNYLGQFGPYFTDRYHTPWGQAINFDGPDGAACGTISSKTRCTGSGSITLTACAWTRCTRIFDNSRRHVLADMADAVHSFGHSNTSARSQ
jgi:maltooligosyltrehalose trehalohydrolase